MLVSIVIAVLSLGLFMTHAVSAEQSTTESTSVSTDTTKGTPSTVAPAPEGTDSDSESKRGRIGGGRPGGQVARPGGHGRPVAQRPHHHPGHHHHPVGLVGSSEPGVIGGVSLVETGYIEPTYITEPTIELVEPEEIEVEPEEVEQEPEEEER